jgi:TonB family protein
MIMLNVVSSGAVVARFGAIFALICAIGFSAPVTAQVAADFSTEIQFNPAAESWARVKRIVTPRYPKEALANGTGAVVDITVSVAADGTVKDVQRVEAAPSDARFESATREVLKHWRFRIALSARCVPIETVGNVRLTFKVVDGKEEISLSHRSAPPSVLVDGGGEARPAPKLVALNYEQVRRSSRYPRAALEEGAQADVWILARVDPATGTVVETETAHVNSHPRFTEELFVSAGAQVMKILRFEPQPELKETITACIPIKYRLGDG